MQKDFHLSFEGKNARVILLPIKSQHLPITELTASGLPLESIRICKGIRQLVATPAVVQDVIKGDPEIDLEWAGKILDISSRAYYRSGSTTLEGTFDLIDVVFTADGVEKERKPHTTKVANSNHPTFPVAAGKYVPYAKFFDSFVVTRSYALAHDDGVKYDFLYQMAKKLHEQQVVSLLGAGPKGNSPIIFQDGGKGYRCALFGKLDGDKYTLLVLVLGQELKLPERPADPAAQPDKSAPL